MADSLAETTDDSTTNVGLACESGDLLNGKNNSNGISDGCVQVAVRVRPMLPKEAGSTECINVLGSSTTKQGDSSSVSNVLQLGGSSGPKFTFDQVFGAETAQNQVYVDRVAPLVANCLEGYNATVVAYGQTGSGKTHTIMGSGITTAMMQEDQQGVLPRAIRSIFQQLENQQQASCKKAATGTRGCDNVSNDSSSKYEFDVRVQFLEIYGEEIRDLLNPRSPSGSTSTNSKLSIRDVGNEEPEVIGATLHKVESAEEAILCLTSGMYRRVTASTAMNEGSSRSHAILSMVVDQSTIMNVDQIEQNDANEGARSQISNLNEHVQSKISRFNFVDLAGSERQKRTQATGQRLKEGIDINKGLLVLGNVISALGDPKKQGKTFVPYRDSKLTRLLKGSLGGNHKTLIIACVSPSSCNMEETLNCLRYANRAKNIQNHAVVNLDSTSQLVAGLKDKIQQLAMDLLKMKTGKTSECIFPLSVVESLAGGGDTELGGKTVVASTQSYHVLNATAAIEAKIEVQKLRAENESYRLQLQSLSRGQDPFDVLQEAYLAKVTKYEREISRLKIEIQSKNDETQSVQRVRWNQQTRSESPELSRLKSQVFGSMSKSNILDVEVKAEEEAAKNLSDKYLKQQVSVSNFFEDDDDDELQDTKQTTTVNAASALDADLFELSNSISVKETLINQLQATQEKFETMREFYEDKLREMEGIVAVKEKESEKLSEELKTVGVGHSRGKELTERLKEKRAQVAELKRKQSELSRLTNVASRNETQIARLKTDVREMKNKKIDLQKQITSERKIHMSEVRKMKKESMQKDRELNKTKREVNKKSQEASKAQKVARVRLEQMNQLKVKYKDTEKRLRMKTVKKGILKKAGLDPIIFGRRRSLNKNDLKNKPKSDNKNTNVDKLRDFFDKKVADVSRRENLAEKLAQEWEEHLELTIQKEESLLDNADDQDESHHALEAAIKYREERIRQLASKLGKRDRKNTKETRTTDEAIIFTKEFNDIVGSKALDNGADIVAKVLFGMVVRERRRIASLARTASSLDDKVQETETALVENEAAFSAFIKEHRLDAAALAQNQQHQILSLMDMAKEGHAEESNKPDSSLEGPKRRRLSSAIEDGNSRLLILANERIDALERQLCETQLARETLEQRQEREESANSMLGEKAKAFEELQDEIEDLRSALHNIKEVASDGKCSSVKINLKRKSPTEVVHDIAIKALQSASSGGKPKRRRSSFKSRRISSSLSSLSIDTSSDSSDSEEVPDWAEDIMADLAIIADGKMPASLLESQEVLEAEAQLKDTVFDRLANPKSFTGVQKQRNSKKNRPTRRIDTTDVAHLDEKEKKNEKITKRSREKASSKHSDTEKRNVFDRLLSPSNLTGTQKQRFNLIQDKKGRNLEKAIESQFVSVRGRPRLTEYDSDDTEESEGDPLRNETKTSKSNVSEKRNETQFSNRSDAHSRLDVFERLSKTTTQAYKEKVNSNIAEKMLEDILSEEDAGEVDHEGSPKFEPRLARVKEYASQDVFERLQKTTTEAFAKKKNSMEDAGIYGSPFKRRPERVSSSDAPGLNLSSKKKKDPHELT
eukprot:CAMPEP_0197194112 /NCGR_PEP_ID=MMETSP1423-20130617/28681_1 /TAXON_ID=476441 /ORGANISM="Pseudo-nitzschia heimii, Strain UNC1101" /LENGTH=1576 /DNA_ID=CAMNT_0042647483 /DNA_START=196 /DNA_END=4926 /DNA_ORIENTATION=-